MPIDRSILMVQRRFLTVQESEAFLLPTIEPLFLIETHMSFEERVHLFRLAWSQPEGFVACEIGSYLGASTAFIAAAASLKKGHVHAIDTWQNDAMPGEPAESTYARFEDNTRRFRDFITPHQGRAERLQDQVPSIDMLLVDGDHSYEGTKAHLAGYASKIKSGGMLVMHDITYEGVQRAIQDTFAPEGLASISVVHSLQAFRVK